MELGVEALQCVGGGVGDGRSPDSGRERRAVEIPGKRGGVELAEGGDEERLKLEVGVDLVQHELLRVVLGLERLLELGRELILQFLLEGGDAVQTLLLVWEALEEENGVGHVLHNGGRHLR